MQNQGRHDGHPGAIYVGRVTLHSERRVRRVGIKNWHSVAGTTATHRFTKVGDKLKRPFEHLVGVPPSECERTSTACGPHCERDMIISRRKENARSTLYELVINSGAGAEEIRIGGI